MTEELIDRKAINTQEEYEEVFERACTKTKELWIAKGGDPETPGLDAKVVSALGFSWIKGLTVVEWSTRAAARITA